MAKRKKAKRKKAQRKPIYTIRVKDPKDPLLWYEAPVYVVAQVTDTSRGGRIAIGRSDWFSEEDAIEHAQEQSTMYPPPQRFVVIDPFGTTIAIYQSGKEVPLFAVENPELDVDDALRILVAHFIISRKEGDIKGAKSIQKRIKKLAPQEWREAIMQFGDPDDPQEREEVRRAARDVIEATPLGVAMTVLGED